MMTKARVTRKTKRRRPNPLNLAYEKIHMSLR
jgi:hypothetical protein